MNSIEYKPVYTLITGASTGLGKEIAIEYARHHINLILVAMPGRNLLQLCQELEILYGIRTVSLEYDLTKENDLNELAAFVKDNFSVNQLVNNAGIGGTMKFEEASCEYLDKIIHFNIRATTMLSCLLLPELLNHKKALILNIASMAAFGPIPYKTIYPASKAFIYSFSRGLNKELQGTGVSVVVVNPAQIVTNPDVTLRVIKQGILGKLGLLTAGRIARIAIAGVEKGKKVIIPGFINKLNRILIKWLPESIQLILMGKTCRKELILRDLFNFH
jgi:uncharacterized protein